MRNENQIFIFGISNINPLCTRVLQHTMYIYHIWLSSNWTNENCCNEIYTLVWNMKIISLLCSWKVHFSVVLRHSYNWIIVHGFLYSWGCVFTLFKYPAYPALTQNSNFLRISSRYWNCRSAFNFAFKLVFSVKRAMSNTNYCCWRHT